MVFCMASIEYKGEREGEERKKRKAISGQTMLNHDTHITYRERGYQYKLNDMAESWLQPSEPVTCAARRRRSG